MAKKTTNVLLQSNGRGYVGGVWLTPQQAEALANNLDVSIAAWENTLPEKQTEKQKSYLVSLNKRLEDARLIASIKTKDEI